MFYQQIENSGRTNYTTKFLLIIIINILVFTVSSKLLFHDILLILIAGLLL